MAKGAGKLGAVLALDEAQKVTGWSEAVKRLWDEETRTSAAASGGAWFRAAACAARTGGEPGGTLRDPAPAALVLDGDAHRLWLQR